MPPCNWAVLCRNSWLIHDFPRVKAASVAVVDARCQRRGSRRMRPISGKSARFFPAARIRLCGGIFHSGGTGERAGTGGKSAQAEPIPLSHDVWAVSSTAGFAVERDPPDYWRVLRRNSSCALGTRDWFLFHIFLSGCTSTRFPSVCWMSR